MLEMGLLKCLITYWIGLIPGKAAHIKAFGQVTGKGPKSFQIGWYC